jgi:hypothetical protein
MEDNDSTRAKKGKVVEDIIDDPKNAKDKSKSGKNKETDESPKHNSEMTRDMDVSGSETDDKSPKHHENPQRQKSSSDENPPKQTQHPPSRIKSKIGGKHPPTPPKIKSRIGGSPHQNNIVKQENDGQPDPKTEELNLEKGPEEKALEKRISLKRELEDKKHKQVKKVKRF